MRIDMKYKKVVIAAVIIVLLLAIVFVSSYYKSVTDDDELGSKRKAILEYLKENKGTNLSKGFNQDIVKSH
jgi:cell division protein FtsL